MKNYILHADDCGLTTGITDSIIEALQTGKLQSTTLMTGCSATEYAVKRLRELPAKVVRTHLNLLEGRSTAPAALLPDLVTSDGEFYLSFGQLFRKLAWSQTTLVKRLQEQVLTEFSAQIDYTANALQLKSVSLDSHLHIHCLPGMLPVLQKLAQRYQIHFIRTPSESRHLPATTLSALPTAILRRELLAFWSKPLATWLRTSKISTADYFIGAYGSGHMTLDNIDKSLQKITNNRKQSFLVEILVHPGYSTQYPDPFYKNSHYQKAHNTPHRQKELDLILSKEISELLKKYHLNPFWGNE